MRPSVGRIVHYTNLGDKDGKFPPQVQAALITAIYRNVGINDGDKLERVDDGAGTPDDDISDFVDLKIFYTSGFFDVPKVLKAAKSERGHWNWPPKV